MQQQQRNQHQHAEAITKVAKTIATNQGNLDFLATNHPCNFDTTNSYISKQFAHSVL